MNVPNLLSLLRLVMVPVFAVVFFGDDPNAHQWAAGVYALAFFTDIADGWIARHFNQITRLGLIPRDGSAIGVLGVGTASVAYDIFSIGDIVKYPIHKSTAIEPVGKVGPGG